MNLHEECLLKYLINPLELFYTTEMLKSSYGLHEKNEYTFDEYTKNKEVNYNKI